MTTPFDNLQPSLAINAITLTAGIFPSSGTGNVNGDTLGFIYDFAGNFVPSGSVLAAGQTLSTSTDIVLYNVFGTTYGGDGTSTFDLPDLNGQAIIGSGGSQQLGVDTGTATVTLTSEELPPPQGGGQSFNNLQPSLPVQTLIATSGVFPTDGSNSGIPAFLGEIANFAGNVVPAGWTVAAGQLLPINGNSALFSLLGTTYGGDGTTDFALPNLQGSLAVGADTADPLGSVYGQASTELTAAELPPNGTPVNNDQPSVAIEYLIATSGIFPSQGSSGTSFAAGTETLGQIVEFAGNFVPSGYALANGQLLTIADNEALFEVIGNLYGGDGTTTFALPNLNGRTVIGADGTDAIEGTPYGSDTISLDAANIPVACYARGTRILTIRGEVAVEELQVGDLVVTFAGREPPLKPVRWMGHRRIDLGQHSDPGNTHPIRFCAGSMDDGFPHRDLLVSPNHRMRVDDTLVTALELVNGATIVQESPKEIEYWHIELDGHDVVLAEGMQAETYQDVGNRSAFENGSVVELYPILDGDIPEPCLSYAGANAAARERLIARAEALGWTRNVDPMPWLEADGQRIEATRHGETCRFTLQAGSKIVRLRSRSARPWDVDPHSGDRRQLGTEAAPFGVWKPKRRAEGGVGCPGPDRRLQPAGERRNRRDMALDRWRRALASRRSSARSVDNGDRDRL